MKKSNEPTKTKEATLKTTRFLSLAALALVGAMMTGCSSDDNIIDEQQPKGNVVTLTTTVNFDDATTRALAIDYTDKTLAKTFAEGDKIAVVYQNTSGTTVKAETEALTADDLANGGKSATFTVTLTDPKQNGSVKYIYPAAMAGTADVDFTKLGTQDGTLATIASSLDLATYEGTLTDAATLPASPSLENGLSIVAFTLKDADGTNDITSTITGMTVSDGTNTYTVNRTAAAGPIYVAIQPTASANIEYTATDDGITNYTKAVTGKTYAAGQFYQLGLRMEKEILDMTATPLTLLVTEAGDLKFYNTNNAVKNLKYTVNGGEEQSATKGGTISLNVGDVVAFYCNDTQSTMDTSDFFNENKTTIEAQVCGNVMSLLDGTSFATATAVGKEAFENLFKGDEFLSNHPTYDLVLPATTLNEKCYYDMFRKCTGLTRTPKLPATTLDEKCYYNMFYGCTGLTDAYMAAPYTTSNKEMSNMFKNITDNQMTLHTTEAGKAAWNDCKAFSFKAVLADYPTE